MWHSVKRHGVPQSLHLHCASLPPTRVPPGRWVVRPTPDDSECAPRVLLVFLIAVQYFRWCVGKGEVLRRFIVNALAYMRSVPAEQNKNAAAAARSPGGLLDIRHERFIGRTGSVEMSMIPI